LMGSLGRYVLTFEEADPDDVKLIGGKASSLVLMTRLGTSCAAWYHNNNEGM